MEVLMQFLWKRASPLALQPVADAGLSGEVETAITGRPPLRTVRALLRHTAPDNAFAVIAKLVQVEY